LAKKVYICTYKRADNAVILGVISTYSTKT